MLSQQLCQSYLVGDRRSMIGAKAVISVWSLIAMLAAMTCVMHRDILVLSQVHENAYVGLPSTSEDDTLTDVSKPTNVQIDGEIVINPIIIWDTVSLRMYCIIGSIMGAFLAVAVLPKQRQVAKAETQFDHPFGDSSRQLLLQFTSSMVFGMMLTPPLIRHCQIPPDADYVMGFSGLVAMLATTFIAIAYPSLVRWALGKINKRVSADE